jgi:hypothetical protein
MQQPGIVSVTNLEFDIGAGNGGVAYVWPQHFLLEIVLVLWWKL